MPENVLIATDVGQHQLWTANYFPFNAPRRFISSCGLGSMGYGLGAAIGAYFATKKPVALITGDGSFNMNYNELLTAVSNGVPIVIFVMNNGSLGMIRELQSAHFNGRYIASDLPLSPDYSALAAALGATGFVAKTPEELDRLLKKTSLNVPVVFDCRIGKNEKSL
jgi:Thiamine pyrophosphate-requiring enzymes [acetolactate synthase, pyruvate dehydrogenase (cytochrome), glyoxylate carboligase, phosphonopyruvate decarboxylase]